CDSFSAVFFSDWFSSTNISPSLVFMTDDYIGEMAQRELRKTLGLLVTLMSQLEDIVHFDYSELFPLLEC
ncbi:hypothetical protein DOY81_007249, partial [Sarcophaga bullata]